MLYISGGKRQGSNWEWREVVALCVVGRLGKMGGVIQQLSIHPYILAKPNPQLSEILYISNPSSSRHISQPGSHSSAITISSFIIHMHLSPLKYSFSFPSCISTDPAVNTRQHHRHLLPSQSCSFTCITSRGLLLPFIYRTDNKLPWRPNLVLPYSIPHLQRLIQASKSRSFKRCCTFSPRS